MIKKILLISSILVRLDCMPIHISVRHRAHQLFDESDEINEKHMYCMRRIKCVALRFECMLLLCRVMCGCGVYISMYKLIQLPERNIENVGLFAFSAQAQYLHTMYLRSQSFLVIQNNVYK